MRKIIRTYFLFFLAFLAANKISAQGTCATAVNITVKTDDLSCFSGYTQVGTVDIGSAVTPTGGCTTADDNQWWGRFTANFTQTELFLWAKDKDNASIIIYSGTCGSLTQVACVASTGSDDFPTHNVFNTTPGQTYYILIHKKMTTARLCLYNKQVEPTKQVCTAGMSFEDGAGAGWVGRYGGYHLVSAPGNTWTWNLPNVGKPAARFQVTSGAGRDAHVGMVPVVAPGGGSYSFRLGAPGNKPIIAQTEGFIITPPGQTQSNQAAAESMTYCFTVNANNAGFGYKYATVMDAPAHEPEIQPLFEVFMVSQTTGDTVQCGKYKHYPNDGKSPFYWVGNDTDVPAQLDLCFTPWTDIMTDLSGFAGQNICVTFRSKDCSGNNNTKDVNGNWVDPALGSHGAYGYFDTYCIPLSITVPEFCAGASSIQICAPAGYQGYTWPAGQPGLTGSPQTQCVNISNPVAGTQYTVNMTSFNGCPTKAIVRIKNIPVTKTNDTTLCAPAGGPIPLTVSVTNATDPPYTFTWSHGLGNNQTVNVSPGTTTTYSVTIRNNSGCTSQETITVTVQSCGPTVTATGGVICAGSCTNISASGSGGTAPFTYTWQPGNLTGATVNVCPAVTTTYTVTMRESGGGTASAIAVVTVNPIPAISANYPSICAGQSTNLSASGANSYTWNPGNSTSNPFAVTPVVTSTYTVTGATTAGCTNSTTAVVTVNPMPVISVSPVAICTGQSTSLTATGANTYTWMPGNLTGTTVTVNPASTTTYTITGEALGCTGTTTVVVTVNTSATITINPATLCQGESTTLSANGATNYTWMPGGTTGNSLTITPPVSITYTVIGTTATGCSGTTTVTVTVNPLPVIQSSDILMCKDSIRTMNASGGTAYTWQPGGQTGSSITLTPSSVQVTTYTITGINSFGCSANTTAVLTVVDCSIPSVTVNNPVICIGSCANLTANGIGGAPPLAFQWTPNIGAGSGPHSVCPVSTTSYTVIVTDSKGDKDTAIAVVTVNPLPNVTATGSTVCAGQGGSLSAGGASTYTWQPSGLQGTPVGQTPASTTTFTVTGTDGNGCVNTATAIILVNPNPVITATGGMICQGQSTTLSASGATGYVWTPATGLSNPNSSNPVASPAGTTTYTITGTDANGCSNTTTAIVIVESIPTVTATSSAICAGSSTTLMAGGAVTYTWLPNNTTGTSLTDTPAITTTYTVIGSTLAGCTNSTVTTVTVNPIPVVNFDPDTAGCSPVRVTFINNSTGAINSTCIWDFGNGVTYTGCVPPQQVYTNTTNLPQRYSVTLSVTSNGCTSSLTRPNIITVYPLPKADFDASPWETEIMEPTIWFTNLSSGDSIRTWNFGDGTTDTGNNPSHVYEDTGHFNVCLSIQNTWGCTDNICKTVIIKPVWSFYIPNAFTPNGDGINDKFNGKGENIRDYELYIYDRWGNLIFESNSLFNDWDGRANQGSDFAQEDVYVYVVSFKDIFDKKHKLIGSVTLVK